MPSRKAQTTDRRRAILRRMIGQHNTLDPHALTTYVREVMQQDENRKHELDPSYVPKTARVAMTTIKDDIQVYQAELDRWTGDLVPGLLIAEVHTITGRTKAEIEIIQSRIIDLAKQKTVKETVPVGGDGETVEIERELNVLERALVLDKIAHAANTIAKLEAHMLKTIRNYPGLMRAKQMNEEIQRLQAVERGLAAPSHMTEGVDTP